MSIESMMLYNHLILYCPLLLWLSIFPSIKVFSNELAICIRCPKYWSICHSSEYSGLMPFKIDWFDLRAVQGTLKSLLQHHSLKGSRLQHSAFFMSLLSHLYITIGLRMYICIWMGLPRWLSGKESVCQSVLSAKQDTGFDPWIRKITWRRKWQPIPVF